jgi:hypothetical protein
MRRAFQFMTRPRTLIAIVACVLATAMLVVAVTPVHDPDVWWVAAAGREMLAHHAVPTENVFSFVEPRHPWLMHEWLFGPAYAMGLERCGPAVFSAIALAVLALALALLSRGTIGRARHAITGLLTLLAAVGFFGGRLLSARPTGVALLFPITLVLLAFAPRFRWPSLALASLVELVWANAHGSFPLGIVIMLVAAVDRRDDRRLRLGAAGAMALATLANPYGLALHRFVWRYFRGSEGVYRAIHLHIKEFGSFRDAWGYTVGPVDLLALVLFVTLAASAARQSRYRARALFCLGMLALAGLHARHLELAGLLSCLLLLPYFDDLADRRGAPTPAPPPRVLALLVLAPACGIGLTAFLATCHRRAPEEWVAGGAALVRSIAALPDGANAFVPFPAAGVAIWYGSPRGVRVFFDSRNDCYSAEAFAAFWALETATTAPLLRRRVLSESRTDAALVSKAHPMAAFLAGEPDWVLSSQEGDWRVFRLRR